MTTTQRIKELDDNFQTLKNALAGRDLADVPTAKILDLMFKHLVQMKKEEDALAKETRDDNPKPPDPAPTPPKSKPDPQSVPPIAPPGSANLPSATATSPRTAVAGRTDQPVPPQTPGDRIQAKPRALEPQKPLGPNPERPASPTPHVVRDRTELPAASSRDANRAPPNGYP